ncbi:hypothetical protein HPB50_023150 [Hyalomma asiaticum]|uniref:Uncharacterized protein n=1 Tax=Hyalomma asiaticum TaxID=266040 RepID=A0ACB7TMH8_HYAAI|nr:hypothetical protein HPB50_023150 [Hyalomma asiaticum]
MRVGLPAFLLLLVCSINAQSDQIRRRPFSCLMEARQVVETACLPEDLREKVLTCQQSAYRTIRARDVHSETDICEELDLMKECIDNALKETSCSRDLTSMRVANDTTAESYARYNVKCRRF